MGNVCLWCAILLMATGNIGVLQVDAQRSAQTAERWSFVFPSGNYLGSDTVVLNDVPMLNVIVCTHRARVWFDRRVRASYSATYEQLQTQPNRKCLYKC